jgi:hypothetical protein
MTKKTVRKRKLRKILTSPRGRVRARRGKTVVLLGPGTYVTERHWEL